MKLGERDRTVLSHIGTASRSVDALAAELDIPMEVLSRRLRELANSGLVYEMGGDRFQRTESGRRVIDRAGGATGSRIDTTPAVERTLSRFDLDSDEADAVRKAFAFLRYWGCATADEIIDGIFSEVPLGYETADRWWTEAIRDPLAGLLNVEAPTHDLGPWCYTGPAEVDAPLSTRFLAGGRHYTRQYGSVKHAIESLDLAPAERRSLRAAFAFLRRRGEVTEDEVTSAVYPQHSAGYPHPGAWWESLVRPAFEQFPGVTSSGEVWQYRQRVGPTVGRDRVRNRTENRRSIEQRRWPRY